MRHNPVVPIAMAMVLGVAAGFAEERAWSRSELLSIADAEARRQGYDVERMSVSFNAYNSLWQDDLSPDQLPGQLTGRDYWAVYYAPMERGALGGDLWVFIDRTSGEVITVLRGQ